MRIKNHYLEDLCFEPLRLYISFFFTLCIITCGIRLYEVFGIQAQHPVSPIYWQLTYKGFLVDIVFSLQVAAFLFPVFGLFHYVSYTVGNSFKLIASVIITLFCFAISQYYITTSVLLGADLWGYSVNDIKTTVGASASVDLGMIFLMIAALLVPIIIQTILNKIEFKNQILGILFLLGMILSLCLNGLIMPDRKHFDKDEDYYAITNKPHHFAEKTVEMLSMNITPEEPVKIQYANKEFPLMHKMEYNDILGPYLNTNEELPNIVVIQVEGLGKTFVRWCLGNYFLEQN